MPKPRKEQVSLEATPYYHCVSRCVRRAFLCGTDINTQQNFEHRRGWLENELLKQAQVFAIDIAAYAIMSNHYHVVLHINKQQADTWSLDEVIERWHTLYKGNVLSQRYCTAPNFSQAEKDKLAEYVEVWRERLIDISWFMRRLNESISRKANEEDGCTGHFWEGRFKSQALLDEKALAACLAYVDLNPIRANMAKSPETSDYTSAKKRIIKAKSAHTANHPNQQSKALLNFAGNPKQSMPIGLPFKLTDYLELLDWTGRIIRDDKRGTISKTLPPILQRLDINADNWIELTQTIESNFKGFVGKPESLSHSLTHFNRQRRPSIQASHTLLS
jgi:REP element-mobilizing transposase RayT